MYFTARNALRIHYTPLLSIDLDQTPFLFARRPRSVFVYLLSYFPMCRAPFAQWKAPYLSTRSNVHQDLRLESSELPQDVDIKLILQ